MRPEASLIFQFLTAIIALIVFGLTNFYFGIGHSYGVGHGDDHPYWHHLPIPVLATLAVLAAGFWIAYKFEFGGDRDD